MGRRCGLCRDRYGDVDGVLVDVPHGVSVEELVMRRRDGSGRRAGLALVLQRAQVADDPVKLCLQPPDRRPLIRHLL